MKRQLNRLILLSLPALLLTACSSGTSDAPSPAASATPSPITAATAIAGPHDEHYRVTLLSLPTGESYAIALNDQGEVVGNYLDVNHRSHAFRWDGTTARPIASGAQISNINQAGDVVGWQDSGGGRMTAFMHQADGHLILLDQLGGTSQALAINDAGQLAGRVALGADRSFIGKAGSTRFIAGEVAGYAVAMNNRGDVLIRETDKERCRTLIWQNGQIRDLGNLGGELTVGRDLNDAGQVVGWGKTAAGEYHPFVWQNGTMTDLSSHTGAFGAAVAIDEAGTILLKASDLGGDHNLLLHTDGTLDDLGTFGSRYAVVNDLNNRGQIVGWMTDGNGILSAFLATPR